MVSNSAVQNVWREDNHRLAQGDVCLFAHAGAQHGMRPGKGAAHGEMDGVLLRAACLRVAGGREYCCRRMRYNEAAAARFDAKSWSLALLAPRAHIVLRKVLGGSGNIVGLT